ncbi:DUF1493 family protein [Apibacter adventoris]|uniref:DUF1493 family protein n=1 Tax=Apibacter adventoris TaxID=1679466 RepID=UPI000CF600F8|nr:DUF1493 family protein [Apibacter adventoris]PQL94410.1 hypothetical protein C4S76_05940 [Apibacter adventoris]
METEKKVLDFFKIHNEFNIKVVNKDSIINPPSLLNDDAEILLKEFIDQFDIQKGYLEIDKYFYNLSDFGWRYWLSLLKLRKYKPLQKPPITIAHMIEVAKRNEWFDPEE